MAVLRVHFFHTANVASEAAAAALHQIERGNAFLRQQGADITFDRCPIDRVSEEIPWSRSVLSDPVDGHAERMVIRGQCHQVAPSNPHPRVPVIFCRFDGERDQGETVRSDWLPFILIDARRANPDGLTLLHEIGHCVGLHHPREDGRLINPYNGEPNENNFMGYGDYFAGAFQARTESLPWQIDALRTAYFYAP